MLKAYVVDDEPLARDELKYILNRTRKVKVVGESDNIEEAFTDIAINQPDIVFLDIQLDEENGMTLAKKMDRLQSVPAICFVTAYDEYALQAFDTNAVDYVLKPYDEKRIQKTLDKVNNIRNKGYNEDVDISRGKNERTDKLAVNLDERIILVNPADIVYLEAKEGKSKLKTIQYEYVVAETLSGFAKKLINHPFLQVHRSFIVNIDLIMEIQPWFNSTYNLLMSDGSKVPVSRTYAKDLKQFIGI